MESNREIHCLQSIEAFPDEHHDMENDKYTELGWSQCADLEVAITKSGIKTKITRMF